MSLPKAPSFDLSGRTALVTGATGEIGMGAVTALAHAGAQVYCVGRRSDALDHLVASLETLNLRSKSIVCDINDDQAVDDMLGHVSDVDVLVNSAGIARHAQSLDTSAEDVDAVLATNVRATYLLTQKVGRVMQRSGGSIITISSQMGHVGGPERSVYCASKHAVEGMTKALAIEWGPKNIRVNTIAPTFVKTPLTATTFDDPEKSEWIDRMIALPRVARVEDLTGAIVFLASDASAMITGTSIRVDGGWTAG